MRHSLKAPESQYDAHRRAALAVLADARVDEIEQGLQAVVEPVDYVELRTAETGLAMLRGRIGGDGAPFNLGEATVTRAAVQIASGEVASPTSSAATRTRRGLRRLRRAVAKQSYRDVVERHVLAPVRTRLEAERATPARADRGDDGRFLHPGSWRGSERVLAPAFPEPVLASQAVFRAVMDAFARPGEVKPLPHAAAAPSPLSATAAALA